MRRYLSVRRNSTALDTLSEKDTGHVEAESNPASSVKEGGTEQNASTTALLSPSAPLVPPNLKVKRVDYYYSKWSKAWKYKNMGEKVTPENVPVGTSAANDPWASFCFVVVRTFPQQEGAEPTFQVIIKSPYLLQACKDVMKKIPGLSWNADPITVCALPVYLAS